MLLILNKKLVDLQADINSLGAIDMQSKKGEPGDKILLLGKHVQSRREVNVSLDSDEGDPWMTCCAVMPNGNLVLCDHRNDSLKLFDNSWVCQESLTVFNIWRLSVVDPNNVIVTVPDEKTLHYVRLLPQLQLGSSIQLDTECWDAYVSENDIYATCNTSRGGG